MSKELDWHFIDYPDHNDVVLIKTTDGDLMIGSWNEKKGVWEDAGRDWSEFGLGVACWADITNVPETTEQMPSAKMLSSIKVKRYAEKSEA